MNDDKTLDEESVKKAITGKGLKFESFEAKEMAVPKAEYVLAVTGTT